MSTRRQLCAAIPSVVSGGVLLAGCSGGDPDDGDGDGDGGVAGVVDLTDSLTFEPETVEVAPGETVRWRNTGTVDHSVTAYEDEIPADAAFFDSGGGDDEAAARDAYPRDAIEGGGRFEHTFEVPGSYDYFCIPHESAGMVGRVVVSE